MKDHILIVDGDIGKLAIPGTIIHKPGKLNPDEVAIMREHCYHGYQFSKKIPFMQEACEIVYAHHGRYDVTGYPRGLTGKQIPLGRKYRSGLEYAGLYHF
jgi:response regulator RpfG family c-di-GMP phosphodiesterase